MQVIHHSARIGENVTLGNFVTIGAGVVIGSNCSIGNNVVIYPDTQIGAQVRIDDFSSIGKQPMRAVTSANPDAKNLPPAEIGDNCSIGTSVVIYRGCSLGPQCLVADLATIRENVNVGKKTIVGRGVAVENFCTIGSFCKLETNSYITAYSTLGNHVFVAPGVVTTNDNYAGRSQERFKHFKGVTVEDGGRIGANATILPGRTIQVQGLVAAGAVATKDVPSKKVVAGSPAKVLRDVPEDQLLSDEELKALV
jgi:UDP-3-O-[3-hydroxymyristoyl] glucosamine N-acyltransferase